MNGSVFATYSFEQIVKYGIATVVFISMILAVAYAVWGGFLMVVSAGDEQKVQAAVNHIRYAFLGIGILVIIIFVAPMFLNLFGLPYGQYFQPGVILSTIQEISANIFGGSADTYDAGNSIVAPSSSDFTQLN